MRSSRWERRTQNTRTNAPDVVHTIIVQSETIWLIGPINQVFDVAANAATTPQSDHHRIRSDVQALEEPLHVFVQFIPNI